MTFSKSLLVLPLIGAMSACAPVGPDKSHDQSFFDRDDLSGMKAGIWVDPTGCDHWIIDDGVEGYLSARIDKYGKPVCSGVASPTYIHGDFKQGSTSIIGDPL
ncbi:hypothetical protein [Puniceibacterium sp. IMCC21224]|uniref:hypothetical protein n=1 Tax=Puniceibacterium sp. IMCC21224 TaxID=1618204 RepID=UPI00064D91DB|nr:hypothetical protein [Puniceibacterium sp. IMCC21224]KMK68903.1 hypothetical protein IMCC21224_113790 [Puniceibacterium sp. IMCC21224]